MIEHLHIPGFQIMDMIGITCEHSPVEAAKIIFHNVLNNGYSLAEAKRFACLIASTDNEPRIALRFLVDYFDVHRAKTMETYIQMHSTYCPLTLKLIGQIKYNANNSLSIAYCDFRKIYLYFELLEYDLEMLRNTVKKSPILSQLYYINVDNKVMGPDGLASSNTLLCSEAFKYETQAAFDRLRTNEAKQAMMAAAKYG